MVFLGCYEALRTWGERGDLNPQQSAPQADALPG